MENRKEHLEALRNAFFNQSPLADGEPEITYALYARKSTESSERQAKSLGDQIAECREFALKLGLKIDPNFIISESESAKEPDIRPKFRALLDAIQAGKVRGVLAWNPDRLARNMKEAGEIIDLLDKEIILDLKFPSFTFENSTSGKMLLGFAFVMSKQYSDKLSDDVRRGMRRRTLEGKYVTIPKHGYYKDPNGFLRPDGENFSIVKRAFILRLEGKKLDDIAKELNKAGYQRSRKNGHKNFTFTKANLSNIFIEPLYAGFLKFGKTLVDLTTIYDFTPVVTFDEYKALNAESPVGRAFRIYQRKNKASIVADLLRGAVVCGECENEMQAAITRKNSNGLSRRYFYFRCDTKKCARRGKSIRARVVVDFVIDFLKTHSFAGPRAYKKYLAEVRELKDQELINLKKNLKSTQAELVHHKKRFEETKDLIRRESDSYTRGIFKNDLKAIDVTIRDQVDTISKIKKTLDNTEQLDLSYSKFLELYQKLPSFIENCEEMSDLDFIIRSMFLNFTIKDGKIANYTIKSPFSDLIKTASVLSSRGDRT